MTVHELVRVLLRMPQDAVVQVFHQGLPEEAEHIFDDEEYGYPDYDSKPVVRIL
jgi:hypothetical protein